MAAPNVNNRLVVEKSWLEGVIPKSVSDLFLLRVVLLLLQRLLDLTLLALSFNGSLDAVHTATIPSKLATDFRLLGLDGLGAATALAVKAWANLCVILEQSRQVITLATFLRKGQFRHATGVAKTQAT